MASDTSRQIRESLVSGGDADALAFSGRWRSWAWLLSASEQVNGIYRQFLLDEQAKLALVARNRPPHIAVFVAQLAAQRPLSMVHSMQSAPAIAADVERLQPNVIAAEETDWTPELVSTAGRIGALGLVLNDAEEGVVAVHPKLRTTPGAGKTISVSNVALQLLSSGTTGPPKRVPLRWDTLDMLVADAERAYVGSGARDAPILLIQPIGNISGLVYIAPAVARQQRIVLLEKFEAVAWANAVRQFRPNRGSVPAVGVRMILDANIPRTHLESLSVLAVGGSKLDAQTKSRFENTYGIPVLTAYGATEFGGVIAHWTLASYREWGAAKGDSVGRAATGVALRTVDPGSGAPLRPNEVGLLEAQVPRIGAGWIRTTDLARVDQDGFLFLLGRADAAIDRGGFKIVPEEVERVLMSHPAVADAAVIGIPHARLGSVPVAAIVLEDHAAQLTARELQSFAREKLLAYQVPVEIRVVAALPRNSSMKVSLPELRALFVS